MRMIGAFTLAVLLVASAPNAGGQTSQPATSPSVAVGPQYDTTGIGASLYATMDDGTSQELTLRREANTSAGTFNQSDLPVHFGLGWGKPTLMRKLPGSDRVVSHGGATGTRLWIDPVAGLVLVFFTNQWAPDRGPEAETIQGTYEAIGWPLRAD